MFTTKLEVKPEKISKVDFDEKAVGFMVCSQPEKMPKVDSDDAEEKVSYSH